jgi:dTDP-4-amino-4,6-dideoxygalactose transaminase
MALDVRPGDEVVTTPYSFFATVGCIARLGARPVFADIEPESFNLDPGAAAALCGPKTRALIPVHLFGRPALLPAVSVPIVEDAAQAIGACKVAGIASCLSFFPSKNLGAFGDGGALLTDDDGFADKVAILRAHGSKPKYVHHKVGGNFRLDALQAAILRVKLAQLASWTASRRANAERYRRLFAATPAFRPSSSCPRMRPATSTTSSSFVPRARCLARAPDQERRGHRNLLSARPAPAALLRRLGWKPGAFPHAERATQETLALPIYAELTEAQQAFVVEQIATFYRQGS